MGPIEEVLDSTVVIDALNGWLVAIDYLKLPKRRGISLITWIEVMAGAMTEDEDFYHTFLNQFTVIEVTPAIAARAARVRRSLRLKLPDAVIYAIALTMNCSLITRNSVIFRMERLASRCPIYYRLCRELTACQAWWSIASKEVL